MGCHTWFYVPLNKSITYQEIKDNIILRYQNCIKDIETNTVSKSSIDDIKILK